MILRVVPSILESETLAWSFEIEGVGFIAVRNMIGIPLVMPPLIPPLLLVSVIT